MELGNLRDVFKAKIRNAERVLQYGQSSSTEQDRGGHWYHVQTNLSHANGAEELFILMSSQLFTAVQTTYFSDRKTVSVENGIAAWLQNTKDVLFYPD